jgi:ATP-dependent protease Clp ATPase subunit
MVMQKAIRLGILAAWFAAGALRAEDAKPLADPKTSVLHQYDLLKALDADKLRPCFTERLRSKITKDAVDKGQQEAAKIAREDLVASVTFEEANGKKLAKVMMKNGRRLTTLELHNGEWLADTLWFK